MIDYNQMPQQMNPYDAPNIGGYPPGYPPPFQSQTSGYQSQEPFPPFIPGVTAPLEVTYRDGTTITIPASNPPEMPNQQYVQGGIISDQGGYNPVTRTITQPVSAPGYSPYDQGQGYNIYNPPCKDPRVEGFSPYYPGNPDYAPQTYQQPQYQQQYPQYYNGYYYAQQQYQSAIQDSLYDLSPVPIQASQIVQFIPAELTDEEKEAQRNNYFANSPWQENLRRQKEIETQRCNIQKAYVFISKIIHGYKGETIDEEAAMKYYDPIPAATNNMFDYRTATDAEKQEYERIRDYQATVELATRIEKMDQIEEQTKIQRQQNTQKIIESQNKLLGLKPGETNCDLKTFLNNGYKILIDIEQKKTKRQLRNGTKHYSINNYRARLSQLGNRPVMVDSKDDEYVSNEEVLKSRYWKNKTGLTNCIYTNPIGQTNYLEVQNPEEESEYEAHKRFLESVLRMEQEDEVKQT